MARTVLPKVFLHIGTRKSGTSYLQLALRNSIEALDDQGLALMFRTREANVRRQLTPLRELVSTGDATAVDEAMAWTAERVRAKPDHRHLITLEDLAELPDSAIAAMIGGLSDFDVEVVLTARHWGLTLPSEWQQCVKERHTGTYRDFIEDVRARSGETAQRFLARQHVPQIVERWGAHAPVSVIAVPPSSRTEGTLVELFSDLVGIDPGSLVTPKSTVNQSLTLVQAEMLRRVNIALGDRLPEPAHSYRVGMREWLTRRSLMKHRGSSIRLPEEYLGWAQQESLAQLDALRAGPARLLGVAEDLVASADLATGPDTVSDTELAEIATLTLADLAADRWREVEEQRAKQRGGTRRTKPQVPPPPAPATRLRTRIGRTRAGRVARRWLRR
ncbi:hypothetical protein FXB39_18410 [Nocardioides sp. BGMRC 2183]|nr:hypothetical protein FXB39_18410 [Nocardioides sp. BGMRC 2183]